MTPARPGVLAPIELWEREAPGVMPPREDLRDLLRALSSGRRLGVLRLLAAGRADAAAISRELNVSVRTVQRDLDALARAGLVQSDPNRNAEVYLLADQALRLLESALTYGPRKTLPLPSDGEIGTRLSAPPPACTVCDNRGFVEEVLGELNTALSDARTYHGRIEEMSSQVLTAHEAERKRIARELHDDTAQALTSILVRLQLLERSTKDDAVHQNVEELRELTSGALDSVRRMAMDLRPAALDDLGLLPAVHAYTERFSEVWPVKVSVNVDGLSRRLPADVELVLYRVVQEALTNVAKHASASHASVSLSRSRNQVTLRIEDDGVGFEPSEGPARSGSLGLFGMRERLALVGGELGIESSKGHGTIVTARAPVAGKRKSAERT